MYSSLAIPELRRPHAPERAEDERSGLGIPPPGTTTVDTEGLHDPPKLLRPSFAELLRGAHIHPDQVGEWHPQNDLARRLSQRIISGFITSTTIDRNDTAVILAFYMELAEAINRIYEREPQRRNEILANLDAQIVSYGTHLFIALQGITSLFDSYRFEDTTIPDSTRQRNREEYINSISGDRNQYFHNMRARVKTVLGNDLRRFTNVLNCIRQITENEIFRDSSSSLVSGRVELGRQSIKANSDEVRTEISVDGQQGELQSNNALGLTNIAIGQESYDDINVLEQFHNRLFRDTLASRNAANMLPLANTLRVAELSGDASDLENLSGILATKDDSQGLAFRFFRDGEQLKLELSHEQSRWQFDVDGSRSMNIFVNKIKIGETAPLRRISPREIDYDLMVELAEIGLEDRGFASRIILFNKNAEGFCIEGIKRKDRRTSAGMLDLGSYDNDYTRVKFPHIEDFFLYLFQDTRRDLLYKHSTSPFASYHETSNLYSKPERLFKCPELALYLGIFDVSSKLNHPENFKHFNKNVRLGGSLYPPESYRSTYLDKRYGTHGKWLIHYKGDFILYRGTDGPVSFGYYPHGASFMRREVVEDALNPKFNEQGIQTFYDNITNNLDRYTNTKLFGLIGNMKNLPYFFDQIRLTFQHATEPNKFYEELSSRLRASLTDPQLASDRATLNEVIRECYQIENSFNPRDLLSRATTNFGQIGTRGEQTETNIDLDLASENVKSSGQFIADSLGNGSKLRLNFYDASFELNENETANYQNRLFKQVMASKPSPEQVLNLANVLRFSSRNSTNNQDHFWGTLVTNNSQGQMLYNCQVGPGNRYELTLHVGTDQWAYNLDSGNPVHRAFLHRIAPTIATKQEIMDCLNNAKASASPKTITIGKRLSIKGTPQNVYDHKDAQQLDVALDPNKSDPSLYEICADDETKEIKRLDSNKYQLKIQSSANELSRGLVITQKVAEQEDVHASYHRGYPIQIFDEDMQAVLTAYSDSNKSENQEIDLNGIGYDVNIRYLNGHAVISGLPGDQGLSVKHYFRESVKDHSEIITNLHSGDRLTFVTDDSGKNEKFTVELP